MAGTGDEEARARLAMKECVGNLELNKIFREKKNQLDEKWSALLLIGLKEAKRKEETRQRNIQNIYKEMALNFRRDLQVSSVIALRVQREGYWKWRLRQRA